MPIYVCSAATGRLTPAQKTEIVRSLTDIYHEVTGTPRYFVRVMFQDVAPGNNYLAGRPAPADQISIRCDTRSGKTNEQKSQMLRRIMRDVATASGAAEYMVSVQLSEGPAANFTEWGRTVPSPGEEDAWFSSLPDALRERLRSLA
jgi:phenylpyruvate tautomerase PptA (4-oxalocrotonate tautomerase family)